MSGPQFLHLQSFSRKGSGSRSVKAILDEVERLAGACEHVEEPHPPEVVYGCDVPTIRRQHAEMLERGKVRVTLKNGKISERGIRQDRHTLLTAVASFPIPLAQVKVDPAASKKYQRWLDLNLEWLKRRFGSNLVSVIAHSDEQYPHIHAFILPLDDPTCSVRDLNPAWTAKQIAEEAARAQGHEPSVALKLGNRAYKAAGRELQDDYHSKVGLRVGLTRTGPKRRRLSRAQWQMEKRQAVENAEIIQGIEDKMVALIEADDALTAKVLGQVSSLDEAALTAETLRRAAQEDREVAARARQRADDAAKAMRERAERESAAILANAQAKAKAVLLEERAMLEQQRAALANQQEQLRKERRIFERDRAFEMKRAVREAITVAILAIKGVIDGSIVHDAASNRIRVSDQTLAQRLNETGIRGLLEPVLVQFCAVWDRLKDRLNRADLAHEQAVAKTDLQQAQQAVRVHDAGEQEVGSPKPAPEVAVNTSFNP